MKAVCWHGKQDVQVEQVADPGIINPGDAVVRVTLSAICGSDLHLYNGLNPFMKKGDILGHEFMGEVVAVGTGVKNLHVGQRVVVPFNIACGKCFFCRQQMFSLCENSNPNGWMQEKAVNYPTAGLFGYSHLYGGYAGGQAEYVRVPYADVGAVPVPEGLSDEQALFVGDILSTGYMAAENAGIKPGDAVAVWGAGPVGLFSAMCARLLGAEKVIVIDRSEGRLRRAEGSGLGDTLNFARENVIEALKEMTGGEGPDACIDAVGMESHSTGLADAYDLVKQKTMLETDRPHALRAAIQACRNGGTVSIPGVYSGIIDNFPMGTAFSKGLTLKMGQTHTHRYMRPLLERIRRGEINPLAIITHRVRLDEAPEHYRLFNEREGECEKVVMTP
jgi:threonine dehydrogenase-like Zn-dependent dehydrogenase